MANAELQMWVITGASSGIGEAVVRAATATGARVLALDVNDMAGQALAAETGAVYQHCDVSKPEDWQAVVDYLQKTAVPTHIHLNAGMQIAPPSAPLAEYQLEATTLDRYRRMMGVNVDGVVFGLKALLPLLEPGAAIVVTASLAGITPYPVDPLYAMSKHAVAGLVRSLGPTLAQRDILINAICPGAVDTAIIPEAQRSADMPFMTAEHLAEEVMHLMSAIETGKTWAKLRQDKPAYIIRAPGDKGPAA